jgi:pimeloyl-ACP methyl ester carboxylesterase
MSALMYEHLMLPLCETYRLRCIATDRRGFGKSEWSGDNTKGPITYNTLARDTADILEKLDLGDFVFVASSMGCGETVLTYNVLSGKTKQACRGFIWLGSALPYLVATEMNPKAPSRELWDTILTGFRQNRAGFVKASLPGVFGVPSGVALDESVLPRFEYIVNQADALAIERCIQIITTTDFAEDLRELGTMKDVKVLVIHGDTDQGE